MFNCVKLNEIIKFTAIILCIALTVTFIFSNSFDDKTKSNTKSEKIVKVIKPSVDKVSQKLTGKTVKTEDLNKYTRKIAHFTEFAILGIELLILMLLIEKALTKLIFMPLFLGLLTACMDEFIQSFNERSDMVSDIFIDFSGCTAGILISVLAFILIKKHKTKKIIERG